MEMLEKFLVEVLEKFPDEHPEKLMAELPEDFLAVHLEEFMKHLSCRGAPRRLSRATPSRIFGYTSKRLSVELLEKLEWNLKRSFLLFS